MLGAFKVMAYMSTEREVYGYYKVATDVHAQDNFMALQKQPPPSLTRNVGFTFRPELESAMLDRKAVYAADLRQLLNWRSTT